MDDGVTYPDRISVDGKMVKDGKSPLSRSFKGEAVAHRPARLFGKIYIDGCKAKEVYDRDQRELTALRVALSDAADALDLANKLLGPDTNQIIGRMAAAHRARAVLSTGSSKETSE